MPLDTSFMSASNPTDFGLAAGERSHFNVRFNLDLLNGCSYNCAGCYVNRKNNFQEKELGDILRLSQEFREAGFRFDEIILGPTDVFGARNTGEILTAHGFYDLFSGDETLTLLSTMQADKARILHIIDLLNAFMPPTIEIEFVVAVNSGKLVARDAEYVQLLKRNLALLDDLRMDVEYAFQMNIDSLGDLDVVELSDYVRREFNTILEFNPSFLRVNKTSIVQPIFDDWKARLQDQITPDNFRSVELTMVDSDRAGSADLTFNYAEGKWYACPFIYENVATKSRAFLIEKAGERYEVSDFTNNHQLLMAEQYAYLAQTSDCAGCKYQENCLSKLVQQYMKSHCLAECPLPRSTMDMYAGDKQ